jgi:pyruvate,water dikinase
MDIPTRSLPPLVAKFKDLGYLDTPIVGEKNASLGELLKLGASGINALDGFATTITAFDQLIHEYGLNDRLETAFRTLDDAQPNRVEAVGRAARNLVLATPLPQTLADEIVEAYRDVFGESKSLHLAVRASNIFETESPGYDSDLDDLYLRDPELVTLLDAVHHCFAHLFANQMIADRAKSHSDQLHVAISVSVQRMPNEIDGASGTITTDRRGADRICSVTGSFGLNGLAGLHHSQLDRWTILRGHSQSIVEKCLGNDGIETVIGNRGLEPVPVPPNLVGKMCLPDEDVELLASWAGKVEAHFEGLLGEWSPAYLEWTKDGSTGLLHITQARQLRPAVKGQPLQTV